MGNSEIMLPDANIRYMGSTSPRNPYTRADRAVPPMDAELIKPMIAPRFSSGRASIKDASNTALPAQFKNEARNAMTHIIVKRVEK